MSDCEWLLSEAAFDLAVPDVPRFIVADDTWKADIEKVTVAPGLDVFLNDIHVHRDFRAKPMECEPNACLTSQVTITGCADIDLLDGTLAHPTPERSVLFRAPDLPVFSFKAGTRYCSGGYMLALGRIERMLDGEVPAVLHRLLDRNGQQSCLINAPSDPTTRALAASLFSRGLRGPLRRLRMEGVVLQLLAAQVAAAADQAVVRRSGSLTLRERAAVEEARQRLLADMRCPPTLAELADAVGLGEKRLNGAFRLMFGMTAFETLRNHRLEHARQVLEEGNVALKEIAFRVGYSHVSNFVHAFRTRYGVPPRQYVERRNRDAT